MIDIRVLRQDPQRVRDNMTVNRHIYRQIEPGVFAYIRGYMAASKQVSYLALEHFDGNKMTASLEATGPINCVTSLPAALTTSTGPSQACGTPMTRRKTA